MMPIQSQAVKSIANYQLDNKRMMGKTMTSSTRSSNRVGGLKFVTLIACSICILACLFPVERVQCGRLQDFIQNLVSGRDSSSSSSSSNNNNNNNSNGNSNSNSNSNSNNDSNDSDASASADSSADQQLTPMMSAMNPFMRYPQFYDSFNPASYGAYPAMSFSNPMGAMSGLSPMTMSSSSLGGAFASPAAFGPSSFGSFGSHTGGNPMSAFAAAAGPGSSSGLGAASSLNNVYASSTPNLMGGYAQYYGRRRR